MALKSMTGFGQANLKSTWGDFHIELRAVNNRFLDIQLRCPKMLANFDSAIKQLLGEHISRGSVSLFINVEEKEKSARLTYDKDAVQTYLTIFREIKKKYKLAGDITLADLLKFSDVITTEASKTADDAIWKQLKAALQKALEAFEKSRVAEAQRLTVDLKKTLKELRRLTDLVEKRAPARQKLAAETMQKRINAMLGNQIIDQQRIAAEIAVMADRLDISEEITRLRSHIDAVEADLACTEPVGKRLNFLLQEMNREANTTGSKANDTEISHLSISLKENIEKIREQIQNIE